MDKRAAWIWIQHALGPGSRKLRRILNYCGTPEAFFELGYSGWINFGIFTQNELFAFREYRMEDAEKLLEYCEKLGQKVITPSSDEYPMPLRNIHDPPGVLYIEGSLPDVEHTLTLCVIGSRSGTEGGERIATVIGKDLAKCGIIVVSGGARGGDIAATRGALAGGGQPICVLGCGIDYPYLMENAQTRRKVVEAGGALVSEYPPGTGVLPGNFVIRNRIMSGLSSGVIVTEAAERSGTEITVREALSEGRDVFAVPGDVWNENSKGTNRMIKEGAKPVTTADDILAEYENRFPNQAKTRVSVPVFREREIRRTPPVSDETLSPDAKAILAVLTDFPEPLEALMAKTGLRAAKFLAAATELELSGLIEAHSGRRFALAK